MTLPMDTYGDTLPPGTHEPGGRDNAFQAHAEAAQEAPDIGQWEGQDVPFVRPSSCIVKGGIPSSQRHLPTYLGVLPLPHMVNARLYVDFVDRPKCHNYHYALMIVDALNAFCQNVPCKKTTDGEGERVC